MKYRLFSAVAMLAIFLSSCSTPQEVKKDSNEPFKPVEVYKAPERPAGQKDVIELRTDPIENVRIGFIGLGIRGYDAIYRYTNIEGVTISAICDIIPKYIENAQETIVKAGQPRY